MRPSIHSRAGGPALALLIPSLLAAGCLEGRFGKKSTLQEDLYERTKSEVPVHCKSDPDCPQGRLCCAGSCLPCCTDSQCGSPGECGQAICDEGECLRGEGFAWPLEGAVLQPLAGMRGFEADEGLLAGVLDFSVVLFDLTRDPPLLRASVPFDEEVRRVILSGGVLFVVTRSGKEARDAVHLVDVSDPARPRRLPVLTSEAIDAAAVDGSLLYVVSGAALYLIDVTAAVDPVLLQYVTLPCAVDGIDASEGISLLACGEKGLFGLNVSDPLHPLLQSLAPVEGLVPGKVLGEGGTWVILGEAAGPGGIREKKLAVVQGGPEGSGALIGAADAEDFWFDGTRILVRRKGGIHALYDTAGAGVTLGTPAAASSMVLAGGCIVSKLSSGDVSADCGGKTPSVIPAGRCGAFADADIRGPIAVAGCREGGVVLMDASAPAFPVVTAFFDAGFELKAAVLLDGALALLGGDGRVAVYRNLGDPGGPVRASETGGGAALAIAASGPPGELVSVDDGGSLRVLRVTSNGTLAQVGEAALKGAPRSVKTDEEHARAYVSGDAGIEVFDLADPGKPVPVATVAAGSPGPFAGCAAAVAWMRDGRLETVDPAGSGQAGPVAAGGAPFLDIALDAQMLVAGRKGALVFYLKEEAGAGYALGHTVPLPAGSEGEVLLHGDVAVSVGREAIAIFRRSLPPVRWTGAVRFTGKGKDAAELSPADEGYPAGEMLLVGQEGDEPLFFGRGGAALYLYRETGGRLKLLKKLDPAMKVDGIRKGPGDKVVVFSREGEIKVLDVSTPASPVAAGSAKAAGPVVEAAAAGRSVCVVDEAGGLAVFDGTKTGGTLVGVGALPPLDGTTLAAGRQRCWAIDREGGVVGVNVIDPLTPAVETYLPPLLMGKILRLRLDEGRLLLAARDRFFVIDVSGPGPLAVTGSAETLVTQVERLVVVKDVVVIVGRSGEATLMQLLDVSDPKAPTLLGTYGSAFPLLDAEAAGDRLLVRYQDVSGPGYAWMDLSCPTKKSEEPPVQAVDEEGYSYPVEE
jgi:hypothetical protein